MMIINILLIWADKKYNSKPTFLQMDFLQTGNQDLSKFRENL